MSRRQWMWVWILILFLLLLVCIYKKTSEIQNSSIETEVPAKVLPQENQDITFKILKSENTLKLLGVFPSQKAINKVIQDIRAATDLHLKNLATVESNVDNPKLINSIASLSQNLAKYKDGYIEYKDKVLRIKGTTDEFKKKDALIATALLIDKRIKIIDNTMIIKSKELGTATKLEHMKTAQLKLDSILKHKRIEFLPAKDILTENSKIVIDHVLDILKKYPDIKVEIGGHTDSDGTEKSNQILSEKRAITVKNYLVNHGIYMHRLVAVGYGESKPLENNRVQANKQLNRRVEFKVIKQKEMK